MLKVTCLIDPQKKLGLLESLVLKVLEKWFRHNITYHKENISNQSIKCNKHGLYECTKRKRK
jgi:hypothetical protein